MADYLQDQVQKIAEGIAAIRQEQFDLRRELLGNGQPGKIQKMEMDIRSLWSRVNARIEPLSLSRWTMAAIAAAVYISLFYARKAVAYVLPLVPR